MPNKNDNPITFKRRTTYLFIISTLKFIVVLGWRVVRKIFDRSVNNIVNQNQRIVETLLFYSQMI